MVSLNKLYIMVTSKILKIKYLIVLIITNLIINNSAINASFNAKINEVKGEIPNITNLDTTTALTVNENKILSVSNFIKKTDYKTEIGEIEDKMTTDIDHDKYITIQDFIRLTSENFNARLKQANLASKNNIANFVKKTSFDEKLKIVTLNQNELNEPSKKVKAISTKALTKDLINKFSILNGAKYFSLGIF